MKIIKNENIDPFDIDGTLIVHNLEGYGERAAVFDHVTSEFVSVQINTAMVRLLKESKARGSYVIVWSRGGYQWASEVIKALGLVDYVDLVLSKPMTYFDDTPVEKWLPYRVFIGPETIYKQTTSKRKDV